MVSAAHLTQTHQYPKTHLARINTQSKIATIDTTVIKRRETSYHLGQVSCNLMLLRQSRRGLNTWDRSTEFAIVECREIFFFGSKIVGRLLQRLSFYLVHCSCWMNLAESAGIRETLAHSWLSHVAVYWHFGPQLALLNGVTLVSVTSHNFVPSLFPDNNNKMLENA